MNKFTSRRVFMSTIAFANYTTDSSNDYKNIVQVTTKDYITSWSIRLAIL